MTRLLINKGTRTACKPLSTFTYLGIFGHVDGYADWGGGWGALYKLFVCGFDIIMHFYSLGLPAGYSYSLAILSSVFIYIMDWWYHCIHKFFPTADLRIQPDHVGNRKRPCHQELAQGVCTNGWDIWTAIFWGGAPDIANHQQKYQLYWWLFLQSRDVRMSTPIKINLASGGIQQDPCPECGGGDSCKLYSLLLNMHTE